MPKSPRWEKMSKSRGNVISPEEVVCGVADLRTGYEFRGLDRRVIQDFKAVGVWCDPATGWYFTAERYGKAPVFLCQTGNPVPPLLHGAEDEEPRLQHRAPYASAFWALMAYLYEDQE